MKNRMLTLFAPLVLMLTLASPCDAQISNIFALNGAAHDITVGMARHNNAYRAYACYSSPGGSAVWIAIGDSSGLTGNVIVHGDQTSGAAFDDVIVMTRSHEFTGACAADTGYVWDPLQYNGFFLDIEGDSGDDRLFGGLGDTIVSGEAGQDVLYAYSCSTVFARGSGGSDADGVNGRAGTCDNIRGDGGADCLVDSSSSSTAFTTYDCGNDSGDARFNLDNFASTTGCPNIHFTSTCQ